MTEAIWLPPGHEDDLDKILYWVERALRGTSEERRAITKDQPLLFSLVYFSHHLKSDDTGGRISLNQMHLDMCDEAQQWRYHWGPSQYRVAWVGPREIGKSTWNFLILPIWAAAHKWRMCICMFSHSNERSRQHLKNITREFRENALLRLDYPELCNAGDDEVDNSYEYVSQGGHGFSARGITSTVLGFKVGNRRPDMLVCDDIEPIGNYSINGKKKRLEILLEMVLPMNLNAVVIMTGTVTRFGSIMHEIVQAAAQGNRANWIKEERIDCRYYPAVVLDPTTGRETSLWPQRWDYAWMKQFRKTRLFQMQMMNMPTSASSVLWTPDDFRYDYPFVIQSQVLSIDPAVKSQEQNDETGLAVIGFDGGKWNACVQWAVGVRLDPDRLRNLLKQVFAMNRLITHVVIEDNNGGDYIYNVLKPIIPSHVEVVIKSESEPKFIRIQTLHNYHQLGWVYHAPDLLALQEQELAFPDVDHDDIVDAVAKGVNFHLRNRPLPTAA